MSNQQTTVYWHPTGATQPRVVTRVNTVKLRFVSKEANARLHNTSGKSLTFKETEIEFHVLEWTCKWINAFIMGKPAGAQPMRTSAIHSPLADPTSTNPHIDFPDLVKVFAASHKLRVPRELKGEDLHDAIYTYIKQQPLQASELDLMFVLLHFSKEDLLKTAVNTIAFQKVFGPELVEYEQLLEVAEKHKVKGEIERLVSIHEQNKRRKDAGRARWQEREAQKVQREADRAEEAKGHAEWKTKTATEGWAAVVKKDADGKKGGQ